MEIWLTEFRASLKKVGVRVYLLRKNVDEVIIVCSMVRRGDIVNKEKVVQRTFESLGEDIRGKINKEENTL